MVVVVTGQFFCLYAGYFSGYFYKVILTSGCTK